MQLAVLRTCPCLDSFLERFFRDAAQVGFEDAVRVRETWRWLSDHDADSRDEGDLPAFGCTGALGWSLSRRFVSICSSSHVGSTLKQR